jgi:hypothetical protein
MVSATTKDVAKKPLTQTQRRELCKIVAAQYDSTIKCLRGQRDLIPSAPNNPLSYRVDRVQEDLRHFLDDSSWAPKALRNRASKLLADIRALKQSVEKAIATLEEKEKDKNRALDAVVDQLITDRNDRVAQIWVASVESGHEFLDGIPTPIDFRKALSGSGIDTKRLAKVAAELPPCPTAQG